MKFPKTLILLALFLVIVLFISGCAEQQTSTNQTKETKTTETVKETETCTPSWTCTDWSVCAEGVQTRTCTDANSCGLGDKPAEAQVCTYEEVKEEPKVKAFENAPNGFDYYNYKPHNETIEVITKLSDVRLSYTFPIMGSPMPYYIYNTTEINKGYYDSTVRQIYSVLGSWERTADYKVKFEEANTMPDYGIKIEIVDGEVTEEASVEKTDMGGYTLITGGSMKVQAAPSSLKKTYLLMHGIGHIFGFDHSSRQVSVMYHEYAAITGGKQIITSDINKALEKLYRDIPEDR